MGTDVIGNNNSFIEKVRAFKQLHSEAKKSLDIEADKPGVNTPSKADPKLSFQHISSLDKAQIEASIDKTANARGDFELNNAWVSKGVQELVSGSLDKSITSVIDKLRSISGDAVEQSSTYKFFNLNQHDSSDIA
jgi:hypothetical protein